MSEETFGKGVRVGEYELEGRSHEVGSELGRLHEARHVRTGNPALVLVPGPRATWRFEGPWTVRIAYNPGTAPRMKWGFVRGVLLLLGVVGGGLAVGYVLWRMKGL